MSSGARNIHALSAVRRRLEDAAISGPCALHPDRSAVGFIDGWDRPRGCCQACADFAVQHGYTVVMECPADE